MIDLYCERTASGLWGEPANLLSNLAFLAAAWAIWRQRRQAPSVARPLALLAAAIAIGSAWFHAAATPSARVFDEAPILVFELVFLWLYGRRLVGLGRGQVALLLLGFTAVLAAARAEQAVLNGSLAYVPPLLFAGGLGVYHYRTQPRARTALLGGAAVFTLALGLRTIDLPLCSAFPLGTHFLWHLLAAMALAVFARGLLANAPLPVRR